MSAVPWDLVMKLDTDAPARQAGSGVATGRAGVGFPGDLGHQCPSASGNVNLVKRGVAHADATQIVRDFSQWPVVDNSLD